VSKVDELDDAINHCVAYGHQSIHGAEIDPVDELLPEQRKRLQVSEVQFSNIIRFILCPVKLSEALGSISNSVMAG